MKAKVLRQNPINRHLTLKVAVAEALEVTDTTLEAIGSLRQQFSFQRTIPCIIRIAYFDSLQHDTTPLPSSASGTGVVSHEK
jgi:hypothetical protein